MQTVVNIFSFKINSISNKGSVDIVDDLSPMTLNGYVDLDVSDHDPIANPSARVTNQF